MTDRLLVLVPHEHTHAPRSILEQARKSGSGLTEIRAIRHTMQLIAHSLCIANGAPAKVMCSISGSKGLGVHLIPPHSRYKTFHRHLHVPLEDVGHQDELNVFQIHNQSHQFSWYEVKW